MALWDDIPYELQSPSWRNAINYTQGSTSWDPSLNTDIAADLIVAKGEADKRATSQIPTNNENGAADSLTDLGGKLFSTLLAMNGDTSGQAYPVAYQPQARQGMSSAMLLALGLAAAAAVYVVTK